MSTPNPRSWVLAAALLLAAAARAPAGPPPDDPVLGLPFRLGPAFLVSRPPAGVAIDWAGRPPRETHRRVRVRVDGTRVVARIHQVFQNTSGTPQDQWLVYPAPGEGGRLEVEVREPNPGTLVPVATEAGAVASFLRDAVVASGHPGPLARPPGPALLAGPLRIERGAYLKVDARYELSLAPRPGGLAILAIAPGSRAEKPLSILALEVDLEEARRGTAVSSTHRMRTLPGEKGRIVMSPLSTLDPSQPFVLAWPPTPGQPGLARGRDDEGRTHVLALIPQRPPTGEPPPRCLVVLLDTGGSTRGPALAAAASEIKALLGTLGHQDRFDVVPFSLSPQPFHRSPVPATPTYIAEAIEFLAGRKPWGAVNFEAAVLTALEVAADSRPTYLPAIVLFTDGRPTIGEVSARRILDQQAGDPIPVFPIASGPDADYYFLEQLARLSGGVGIFLENTVDRIPILRQRMEGRLFGRGPRITLDGAPIAPPPARDGPLVVAEVCAPDSVLEIDGIPYPVAEAPEAGTLPSLVGLARSLAGEIWSSLVGAERYPGGAASFKLLGLVPGTPRPTILHTLRDGVGPEGRARVLTLSAALDQGTFDPVDPGKDHAWSGYRHFSRSYGRWLEAGIQSANLDRCRWGSAAHLELLADTRLAPHFSLDRSVGVLLTTSRGMLVETPESTP